jgi:hypothetical protein
MKKPLNFLWIIFAIIPIPFLFPWYEYEQKVIRHKDAHYLGISFLLYIVITGLLSVKIKLRYVFLLAILSTIISLFLGSNYIPDDGGWFKPVGRNGAVIFIAIVALIGQLIVRIIGRSIFPKNYNQYLNK